MQKSFDELSFSDDWMFLKVMQNPTICAELVERLLHIQIDHVEYPELEQLLHITQVKEYDLMSILKILIR